MATTTWDQKSGMTSATDVNNLESYVDSAEASATAAANSATSAETAEINAVAAQSAAEAAYDSFDDRYLGAKSSAPSTDNDGNALITGALYFDTTIGGMYVWNGSSWAALTGVDAGVTTFNTRSGAVTLSASDVNTALGSDAVLDSDIGSTVQAYSAVLSGTTASFTTAYETKLNDIDPDADVTDTENVTAAGALMDTELTDLAGIKALDTSTLATLTGTQTLTNKTLSSPTITGDTSFGGAIDETVYNLTGTAIDPSNGTIQWKEIGSNVTLTDSISEGESVTVMIKSTSPDDTVTWPTTTWINNGGTAPSTITASWTVVALWKVSTTLYGALVGDGS